MDMSLVSIGLPTYNRDKYLPRAIESLLKQTYRNIELIISDNASNDRTNEICQEYLKKDSRIRYYRNETNIGMVRNVNRVFSLAQGKYYHPAGDDDTYEPQFVEECVSILEKNLQVVLVTPLTNFPDRDDGLIAQKNVVDFFNNQNRAAYERAVKVLRDLTEGRSHLICGLIRRQVIAGNELAKLGVIKPDRLLLLELALSGEFRIIDKVLRHSGDAAEGRQSKDEKRSEWYDPARGKKLRIKEVNDLRELLSLVRKSSLNWCKKCRLQLHGMIFCSIACIQFIGKMTPPTYSRYHLYYLEKLLNGVPQNF